MVLPPDLKRELKRWCNRVSREWRIVDLHAPKSNLIFPSTKGRPFSARDYLDRWLRAIAKRASIERLTFQMLRRTFCTHFCARGTLKDAQQQLRHTNPAMTMRYFQVVPESLRSAVEELDQAVMEPMPAKPSRKRRQPVPIADQAATPAEG